MNPSTNLSTAMFPRRELLQKAASYALLLFASRPKSVVEIPTKYPAPDFAIGDQVASYTNLI